MGFLNRFLGGGNSKPSVEHQLEAGMSAPSRSSDDGGTSPGEVGEPHKPTDEPIPAAPSDASSSNNDAPVGRPDVGKDGLEQALADFNDERVAVRQRAAQTLGGIGSRSAVDALVQRLDDNTEVWDVRWLVVDALLMVNDERAASALTPYLLGQRQGGQFQDQLIQGVGEHNASWASSHLLTLLRTGNINGNWKKWLAKSMCALASPAMLPGLVEILGDGGQQAKVVAAKVLAKIGDPAAVQPLKETMISSESNELREAAADALVSLGAASEAADPAVRVAVTAAAAGAPGEVVAALGGGSDPNAPLSGGSLAGVTPLTWAAAKGELEIAERLLDLGADVDAPSTSGSTALALASTKGHFELVRLLVSRGASVNAKAGGGTPLMSAAMRRQADLMQLLLTSGADVNARTDQGGTALAFVFKVDTGPAGIQLMPGEESFLAAAKMLLTAGADPNASDAFGQTPLIRAAVLNQANVCRALLEAGADPMLVDEDGKTALDHANTCGCDDAKAVLKPATRT